MGFGTFTMLYSHHHCLIPQHFHHRTRKYTLSSPSPQRLAPTDLFSVSVGLPIQDISCKWNRNVNMSGLFHLACCHGSPTLQPVTTFLSELNNIPLYRLLHFLYLFIFKTKGNALFTLNRLDGSPKGSKSQWIIRTLSSIAQSCSTLCSPMDCSMPGFPVH